jgi:16S rRNA processing protein RimM
VPESRILLGVIGRPHGVRGLVHVTSHTAEPAALAEYGVLSDDKGRRFTLAWRGLGVAEVFEVLDGVPVRVADRDAAGRLTNTRLYVERARLPGLEDDEFYLADLVGLAAVDAAGGAIGRVAVVHDYGAGASLEIAREGAPLIVPFTRAAVPEIDVAGGRVVVSLPAEVDVGKEDEETPSPVEGGGGSRGTKLLRDPGADPSPQPPPSRGGGVSPSPSPSSSCGLVPAADLRP